MKKYNLNNLACVIQTGSMPVILFGAGQYGRIAHYALRQLGIGASFFCDSDPNKHGTMFCGIKVISPEELSKLDPGSHIFITCNYISPVVSIVRSLKFTNFYNCVALFEGVDFTGLTLG